MERLPEAVARDLPGRALSGLQQGREDALPPDQSQDRQPAAPADGGRGDRHASSTRTTRAAATSSSKGKYVEIEPEEIEAIEFENTHTIDIDKFVPEEEIDKRYYERPYYIVPDGKTGEEAFAVIRDAMKDKGRVALAGIVFANREHILAIEPWGKGMLGTTLRYDYEVRDEKEFFKGIASPRVPKEMVSWPRTSSTPRPAISIPPSSRTSSRWRCASWSSARRRARRSSAPEEEERRPTSSISWRR